MPESGNGIAVLSFSWGASNPVTIGSGSGGPGAGKVSISSFNIMKHQDAATLKIIEGVATGKVYPEMIVTVLNDKGQPSFRFVMKDVYFESVQHSHSDCGNLKCGQISESVSIAVTKWKWEDLTNNKSYQYQAGTSPL